MEFAAISFVFSLAIQLQVCLVALERVDVNNIVLHAPEQYHVACGKVSPVADLKQRKQKAGSVVERRRKATLPAVLGTPEHCGLIRRDLVVCPPFWLLPRIETGDSFYGPAVRRCCGRIRRKMCLHGLCGENLSEVMGDIRSVLPECTLIMPDNRGNSLW